MGLVNDVLVAARSRLLARPALASFVSEANTHIVAKPRPPMGGGEREIQLSIAAFNHEGLGLHRGRLKVTVWVEHHKDEVGDDQASLTRPSDDGQGAGLLRLLELIRDNLHHSYLNGGLDECLHLATLSAPEAGSVDDESAFVMGEVSFDFGVIAVSMPFQATNNDATVPDIGEPEEGEGSPA